MLNVHFLSIKQSQSTSLLWRNTWCDQFMKKQGLFWYIALEIWTDGHLSLLLWVLWSGSVWQSRAAYCTNHKARKRSRGLTPPHSKIHLNDPTIIHNAPSLVNTHHILPICIGTKNQAFTTWVFGNRTPKTSFLSEGSKKNSHNIALGMTSERKCDI